MNNINFEAHLYAGMTAERIILGARHFGFTPDELATAARAVATLNVVDHGTLTGEQIIGLANLLAPNQISPTHGAILSVLADLRDLAWAIEDGKFAA